MTLSGANLQLQTQEAIKTSPDFRDGFFTCQKLLELSLIPNGHLDPEISSKYDECLDIAINGKLIPEFREGYLAAVRELMQPEFERDGPEVYRMNGGF